MRIGGVESITNTNARQVIVIGKKDPNDVPSNFLFVNMISERDAIITNRIVFVRQAYLGDETVAKGWAAYIQDKTKEPYKWIKLIEQESVDGPWGINEEIRKNIVTKSSFDQFKNEIKSVLKDIKDVKDVIEKAHKHNNQNDLDKIDIIGGFDTPEGKKLSYALTIGGKLATGTYYYDCFRVSSAGYRHIVWLNPITGDERTTLTSTNQVATRFGSRCASILYDGCKLSVRTPNNSINTYIYHQQEDGSFVHEFLESTEVISARKTVTFVDALPTASENVTNGYYCITAFNAYFRCIASGIHWKWEEITYTVSSGAHATIEACCRTDWNKCVIAFSTDPSKTSILLDSIVVRTFNSPAESITDGITVATVKSSSGKVTDVCPISDSPVYYTVFQRYTDGTISEPASAEAKFLDWETVLDLCLDATADHLFAVGDTICIDHEVFGSIPFAVVNVDPNRIMIAATKPIINLEYDGAEHGYKPTTDTTYQSGKTYYTFQVVQVGNEHKEQYIEIDSPVVGDRILGTVFEQVVNERAYDKDKQVRHGSLYNYYSNKPNIYQWLGGGRYHDDYRWYVKGSDYDTLGHTYTETSKTKNSFWLGIKNSELRYLAVVIRLPSKDDEVLSDEFVWTGIQDPANKFNVFVKKRNKDGSIETKSVPPEGDERVWSGATYKTTVYGVAPVLTIGYFGPT